MDPILKEQKAAFARMHTRPKPERGTLGFGGAVIAVVVGNFLTAFIGLVLFAALKYL